MANPLGWDVTVMSTASVTAPAVDVAVLVMRQTPGEVLAGIVNTVAQDPTPKEVVNAGVWYVAAVQLASEKLGLPAPPVPTALPL
jgi:hypothetical protein